MHAGDGLAFFDRQNRLRGTSVNAVRGRSVFPQKMEGIAAGTLIHRNHDHEFLSRVANACNQRRIAVRLLLSGLTLTAVDEDGNRAEVTFDVPFAAAQKPERAAETIRRQLEKMGDTEFACAGVEIETGPVPFVPVAALNAARRAVLTRLSEARERNRPRAEPRIVPNDTPFPEKELTYLGNVLNRKAEAFYQRHGVEKIEAAAESGLDLRSRKVMTTRYCILEQLGRCRRDGSLDEIAEPLALIDDRGRRLELRFDCVRCGMEVWLGR